MTTVASVAPVATQNLVTNAGLGVCTGASVVPVLMDSVTTSNHWTYTGAVTFGASGATFGTGGGSLFGGQRWMRTQRTGNVQVIGTFTTPATLGSDFPTVGLSADGTGNNTYAAALEVGSSGASTFALKKAVGGTVTTLVSAGVTIAASTQYTIYAYYENGIWAGSLYDGLGTGGTQLATMSWGDTTFAGDTFQYMATCNSAGYIFTAAVALAPIPDAWQINNSNPSNTASWELAWFNEGGPNNLPYFQVRVDNSGLWFVIESEVNSFSLPLTVGSTYTLSMWVRNTGGTNNIGAAISQSNGLNGFAAVNAAAITTTWGRVSGTGVMPTGATGESVYLTFGGGLVYQVAAFQVEAGSTPTPWQDSPISATNQAPTRPAGSLLTIGELIEGYRQLVLRDRPVGYWPLGEASGTVAHDSSGQGSSGAITGGVTLGQPGPLLDGSTAMAFDGSTGYIPVATASALQLGSGPLSLEAWFKTGVVSGPFYILVSNTGNSGPDYWLGIRQGTTFMQFAHNGEGVSSTSSVNDDRWHHAVGVWDGQGTASLYIDGVLQGAATGQTGALTNGIVRLGCYNLNDFWLGDEAQVAIYPTALTAQQIADHYAMGTQLLSYSPAGDLLLAVGEIEESIPLAPPPNNPSANVPYGLAPLASANLLPIEGALCDSKVGWQSYYYGGFAPDPTTTRKGYLGSMKVTTIGGNGFLDGCIGPWTVQLPTGTTLVGSLWLKGPAGVGVAVQSRSQTQNDGPGGQTVTCTGAWQFVTVGPFTTTFADAWTLQAHEVVDNNPAITFWVDALQLIEADALAEWTPIGRDGLSVLVAGELQEGAVL